MLQPGQLVLQTCDQLWVTHASAEHRGPVQFCSRSQSQLQPPQVPQVGAPQLIPAVLRAQLAVSVSVPLPVLQLLPPQVYVVVGRVRLPELVQRVP